jgi:hypothetical protein
MSGRYNDQRRRVRLLAGVVAVAAIGVASLAIADSFDPSIPKTIVVGKPAGFATGDRIDRHRRGQSSTPFPKAPTELWRRELAGGLELPPVIDPDGEIVAALVSPDLVRIGKDGRQQWRTRLGAAPAVVPPVLTSDGSTFVVASDGTAWSVSAGGTVRFGSELEFRTSKALAAPLAMNNGSVAVAGDLHVAIVGSSGVLRATAKLPSRPVGALMRWRRGILIATQNGDVYHWRSPTRPRKLGSVGGALEGGLMMVSKRAVVGVVDRNRVVVLDLKSGNTTLVIGEASTFVQLEGPTALAPNGELLVTSIIGEMFGIDAHGVAQRRVALEPLPAMFGSDAGAPIPRIFRRLDTRPSPPLIVDASGTIAFIRNSGKVGLVTGDGTVGTISRRLCARPITILPAGPGRLLAACRSGSIALFGDKTRKNPDAGVPDR